MVNLLNDHVNRALKSEDVRKRFSTEGAEPAATTPMEFGKLIAAESKRWEKVIQEAKVTVD